MTKNFERSKMWIMLVVYILFIGYKPSQMFIGKLFFRNLHLFMYNAAIYAFPIILAAVFYGKETLKSFGYFKKDTFKKIGLVILCWIAVMAGNIFMSKLIPGTVDSANQDALNKAASQVPIIYTTLLFGVLGPFVEEVIFRHIMIGKFSERFNTYLTAFISLVVFDSIHIGKLTNMTGFFTYLPVSIALTWAYLYSKKNIAFSLSIHVLNNVFTMAILPIIINVL